MPRSVVVCGGGFAGLVTALSALESGAEVTILEKGPRTGGSTLVAGGLVWTFRERAHLEHYMTDGNPVLQSMVWERLDAGRDWLLEQGVTFVHEDVQQDHGVGLRLDPVGAIEALTASVTSLGGTIRTSTALERLVTGDRGIQGVVALQPDGTPETVACDAVVLATGGFQGNIDLLRRYLGPEAGSLYLRANSWSTGDGLLAATRIGAATSTNLGAFYGHALPNHPAHFGAQDFRYVSQQYGNRSVAVNMAGCRFTDESEGTGEEVLNQELARQPDARGFYIFDHALADGLSRPGRAPISVLLERTRACGGTVVTSESLEGLCDQLNDLGVPGGKLQATLERFNDACARGLASDPSVLNPVRTRFAQALEAPPFYAVDVRAGVTLTAGGLAVDETMRVIRRAGSSSNIAQSITQMEEYRVATFGDLFAAGVDVGDINGRNYMGGLAAALVTGRIAGSEAAIAGS